jgi:hypothetical protein
MKKAPLWRGFSLSILELSGGSTGKSVFAQFTQVEIKVLGL